MKVFRVFFISLFILILIPICIVVIWYITESYRDPVHALTYEHQDLSIAGEGSYQLGEGNSNRHYTDFMLVNSINDTARITVSFPRDYRSLDEALPVIFIIGGLEVGRKSLSYVKDHGENILVSYEYPYTPEYWYKGSIVNELFHIREAVYKTPGQMVAAIQWVLQQPWADSSRISLLGYSFGAIGVPSIQRLAQQYGILFKATIMGYGGADLQEIFMANFDRKSKWINGITTSLAAQAIRAIEPELHLPYLEGNFLLINGKYDDQIPTDCWKKFQRLTPQPKTIILLDEGHMHPRKPDLTQKLVNISRVWLVKQGLVNWD